MRLISSRPCFCASRFINQSPKQSFLQGLSDENKTDKTTRYLEEHKGPTYSSGSYFFWGGKLGLARWIIRILDLSSFSYWETFKLFPGAETEMLLV